MVSTELPSPTADLALSQALRSPLVCLKKKEMLLLSQECDDTPAHWGLYRLLLHRLSIGPSTQNDAMTAFYVGFNI